MEKSPDAYRTISEVAEELKLPQHVLRFWETRFPQIKPMKRGGNRRFYKPGDVELLRAIKSLLYGDGYTIKGVQRILKEQGPRAVASLAQSGQVGTSGKRPQPSLEPSLDSGIPDGPDVDAPAPDQLGSAYSRGGASLAPQREPPDDADRSKPDSRTMAPVAARARDSLEAVLFELAECERILAAAAFVDRGSP